MGAKEVLNDRHTVGRLADGNQRPGVQVHAASSRSWRRGVPPPCLQ